MFAIARQIICFAATGLPAVGKVNLSTLQLTQKAERLYMDKATEGRIRETRKWVLGYEKLSARVFTDREGLSYGGDS